MEKAKIQKIYWRHYNALHNKLKNFANPETAGSQKNNQEEAIAFSWEKFKAKPPEEGHKEGFQTYVILEV